MAEKYYIHLICGQPARYSSADKQIVYCHARYPAKLVSKNTIKNERNKTMRYRDSSGYITDRGDYSCLRVLLPGDKS
jgi:hypothetical protein